MSTANIIETVNISHEVIWQPWAVSYFFFIGIAVGAALLSLMWTLFKRDGWESAGRMSVVVMLISAIVAPVALIADLHQPGRFWHFYTHFTAWSWMSWGAFFLPIFVALAVIYGWICLRTQSSQGERLPAIIKPLALLLGIMGLLVALYTGEEVMVLKSRPMWHTSLLPFVYLFSGLAGAAGLSVLFKTIYEPNDLASGRKLATALSLFSFLTLLILGLWIYLGMTGMSNTAQQTIAFIQNKPHWQMLGLGLAVLFGIPLLIGLFMRRGWFLALTALLAVAGTWLLRWVIFMDGQLIPKTGAGEYSYQLPMGSDGVMGIVGIFGLWLFVAIVITSFFFRENNHKQSSAIGMAN